MKLKTIQRREWRGINKISYAEKRFETPAYSGIAGLMRMDEADDSYVNSSARGLRYKITSNGYSWLHLVPKEINVWATVMFDENGRLFNCYFDITKQNALIDGGKSFFYDLYLDAITAPWTDEITYCDEDELEEAHKLGEIDAATKESAYKARGELEAFLKAYKIEFYDFCRKTRLELMTKLITVRDY